MCVCVAPSLPVPQHVVWGHPLPIPNLSLWPVSEAVVGQEEGVRELEGVAEVGWPGEVGLGGHGTGAGLVVWPYTGG